MGINLIKIIFYKDITATNKMEFMFFLLISAYIIFLLIFEDQIVLRQATFANLILSRKNV